MKTHELTGTALDWAVQQCEGQRTDIDFAWWWEDYSPSTNWAQGGVIIEREKIELFMRDEKWFAYSSLSTPEDFYGETPLIAAMRCYVASVVGAEIDVPVELTKGELNNVHSD
jgi:hypothetical protein